MKKIKYFLQFICVIFFFVIFKILGLKLASIISSNIFILFGPIFRSNKIVLSNLKIAFPDIDENQKKQILKKMWFNYGKIFAEYMFIKDFRHNEKYSAKISIENKDIIEKIKKDNEQVIFISGHFNNFELMAMQIEKIGIKLTAAFDLLLLSMISILTDLNIKNANKAEINGEVIQLEAISNILSQETAPDPFVIKTKPTMAPTIEWVVETGQPFLLANMSQLPVAKRVAIIPTMNIFTSS